MVASNVLLRGAQFRRRLQFHYIMAKQGVDILRIILNCRRIPVFLPGNHVQLTRARLRNILVDIGSVTQLHFKLVGVHVAAVIVAGGDVLAATRIPLDLVRLRRFCQKDFAAVLLLASGALTVIGIFKREKVHLARWLYM